ncbi:hypothetical protein BDZ45DRAFT_580874 [Acephala macrosclerotiorum]|nr:hypothetical protein BDZ45DRAFT_580874 [Acephala macrosclerotiorum]
MGSGLPQVQQLERPEPLQKVLAEDKVDDCTPCRVTATDDSTGSAAFLGLGAYSYFSGHSQLQAQRAKIMASKSIFGMRSRQAGITSIAIGLGLMGFWRLVN